MLRCVRSSRRARSGTSLRLPGSLGLDGRRAMEREQWTTAEVAAHLGVSVGTVRAYSSRGQMPAPDGRLGRTPWWWAETIRAWAASRSRA